MHPHDFVIASSGGSFMPILVFLIWIVASIVAQSQKKKKRQQSAGAGSATAHSADVTAELKRQLETIFSEKQEQPHEHPQPRPAGPEQMHEAPAARETLDTKKTYDTQDVVFEKHEMPGKKPAAAPVKPPAPAVPVFQAQGATPVAMPELKLLEEEHEPVLSLHSIDDARKGFLWSEVLGPPLALREPVAKEL